MTYTLKVVEDETERVVGVVPEMSLELCGMFFSLWKKFLVSLGVKVVVLNVEGGEERGITRADVRAVLEK